MRLLCLSLVAAVGAACMTTESPVVQPCKKGTAAGEARSAGALTVLPSQLPGLRVTRASWSTRATHSDGVTTEYLTLTATLHADRRVGQDEVALLYDAPGPHAVVDDATVDAGSTQFQLSSGGTFLDAGAERTTARLVQVDASYRFGSTSALGYCPSTVRVVRRDDLALALAPELRTPQGQKALLARAGTSGVPLVVLKDTVVATGPGSTLLTGAAISTADTALTDMVVGLVVRGSASATGDGRDSSIDTLEYHVRSVPPHAIVPFSGGWLNDGERIVQRVAYPLASIHERSVAGEAEMHRAREARRESEARTRRRAQCTMPSGSCAH